MNTRAGMFALVGPLAVVLGCPTILSFPELPLARREAILRFWASSPIPLVRKVRRPLGQALCCCACKVRRLESAHWLFVFCLLGVALHVLLDAAALRFRPLPRKGSWVQLNEGWGCAGRASRASKASC